jgi:hypothetical protein
MKPPFTSRKYEERDGKRRSIYSFHSKSKLIGHKY